MYLPEKKILYVEEVVYIWTVSAKLHIEIKIERPYITVERVFA